MNGRVVTAAVGALMLTTPVIATGAHAQALAAAALREQAATAAPATGDYKIGPQDTLEIDVFQLNDLNRTVQVDSSGRILLPLLGQMPAAGKTSRELSDDIAAQLGQKYLNNPQVTVVVKDAQGQRITVDGAVTQPGVYNLTGPTTLMQAVALAKGPDTKMANLHKVIVYRMAPAGRSQQLYDLQSIRDGKTPDPLIYGKDVIVVDQSGGRSFLRDLGTVAPIISMLRWGW
ncbi:MAG TPA: polysaccharide biosynthesis/export family protein [Caulobacteraceae bacterium]|jgi:polysaccharide export outer membrane protein